MPVVNRIEPRIHLPAPNWPKPGAMRFNARFLILSFKEIDPVCGNQTVDPGSQFPKLPAEQVCAPGDSGAECGEEYVIASFDFAGSDYLVECDYD